MNIDRSLIVKKQTDIEFERIKKLSPTQQFKIYDKEKNEKNRHYFVKESTYDRYDSPYLFNYYILIRSSNYKLFKKINPICTGCYNDTGNSFHGTLQSLSKFLNPHYKKDIFYFNNIKYIRIKLRALSNKFIPIIDIFKNNNSVDIKDDEIFFDENNGQHYIKRKEEHLLQEQIIGSFINDPHNIRIMAVPVKKKYTNLIYYQSILSYWDDNTKDLLEFDINENLTIYILKDSRYINYIKKSIDLLENNIKIKREFTNLKRCGESCYIYDKQKDIAYEISLSFFIPPKLINKKNLKEF